MHSFAEVQFPPSISYGSKGGPLFSTEIVETFSGHEQRKINWREARARYDVATGVKTCEEWQELIAFFRARRGRAIGFRYKDWADYAAINQRIGKGDGSQKEFQLVKHYINSNYFYSRKITKPLNNGRLHIYVDGILQQTQSYVVDYTKGLVSFNEALRADEVISADFEFDVPVRFDTDHLDLSMEDYGVASCNSIPLVEIRVDELRKVEQFAVAGSMNQVYEESKAPNISVQSLSPATISEGHPLPPPSLPPPPSVQNRVDNNEELKRKIEGGCRPS